jgi:hypothetical protein
VCHFQEGGNVTLWAPPFSVEYQYKPLYEPENAAPFFDPKLLPDYYYEQCDSPTVNLTDWMLALPEIEDPNVNDTLVSIDVKFRSDLITYDSEKLTFTQVAFTEETRKVKVEITLTDD